MTRGDDTVKGSSKVLHRVARNSKNGKWVVRSQSGASGKTVISVRESTYKKGKAAAARVLTERTESNS